MSELRALRALRGGKTALQTLFYPKGCPELVEALSHVDREAERVKFLPNLTQFSILNS